MSQLPLPIEIVGDKGNMIIPPYRPLPWERGATVRRSPVWPKSPDDTIAATTTAFVEMDDMILPPWRPSPRRSSMREQLKNAIPAPTRSALPPPPRRQL